MMAIGGASGGGGSKSGDVRAGGAYVEVSAKDNLTSALVKINNRVKKFASGVREVGASITLFGAAAVAPFLAIGKSGVDRAEGIARMAKELQVTTDQMQRLQYAADVTGSSIDDIMKNPGRFSEIMGQTPLLDTQAIKDSVAVNQELRKSWVGIQNALVPLVSYFVPVVKTIGAFVKENQGLIRILAIGAGSIVALGVAVVAVGAVIGGAATTFGALVTVVTTIVSVIGTMLTPVFWTVTAAILAGTAALAAQIAIIGGAIYAFVKFTDVGSEAASVVTREFFSLLGTAKQTIGGIISALGQGDLKGAWEITLAGLTVVWESFKVGLTRGWVTVKDKIVDTFKDMLAEIKKLMLDANAFILRNDVTGYLSGGKSDQQINADRDAGKAQIDSDRAKQKQADREFRDKQVEDARAELKKAQADLDRLTKPRQKADQAKRPEDYMYFAGIASRGAFRITGDQRQFSEGSNMAKEQVKLAGRQVMVQQETRDEIKQLNKNLRLQ